MFHHKPARCLSLSLLVTFLLTACSGVAVPPPAAPVAPTIPPTVVAPTPAPQPTPPTGGNVTELKFYYLENLGNPTPGLHALMETYIADFNRATPNIRVSSELLSNFADVPNGIKVKVSGGQTPPAVLMGGLLYALKAADLIMPVDDCIAKMGGKAYLDDVFPALWRNAQEGGQTWNIPFFSEIQELVYNKDAFKEVGLDPEKPPVTWNELADYAQKLTKRDASGNVTRWGIRTYPFWWGWEAFSVTNGQPLIGGDPSKVMFDSPAAVEALQYLVDLSKKYRAAPEEVSNQGPEQDLGEFENGKVAMRTISSRYQIDYLKIAKFSVGIAYVPAKKQFGAAAFDGGLYILKNTSPAEQDAACQFIRFLTSPERLADWSIRMNSIATRRSAYDVPVMREYIAKYPQIVVARDELQYDVPELWNHTSDAVFSTLTTNFAQALAGYKTPQEALQKAQKEAEDVMAKAK